MCTCFFLKVKIWCCFENRFTSLKTCSSFSPTSIFPGLLSYSGVIWVHLSLETNRHILCKLMECINLTAIIKASYFVIFHSVNFWEKLSTVPQRSSMLINISLNFCNKFNNHFKALHFYIIFHGVFMYFPK